VKPPAFSRIQNSGPGIVRRVAYKWIVLSVTTIGAMMAAIDATIVILAIPDMLTDLHTDLLTVIWVIVGYILVSTVFLLTFGRVADLIGRVRMYNLGFVVFTVGSLLCGLSVSAGELVASRLLQGAGAAMMLVNSIALITEAFPADERGRALGINAVTWAAGGVIGPVLGGLILQAGSWRWIFFINIPIGFIGALWGYLALREISTGNRSERFDPLGAVTFSLSLLALLLALTLGIQFTWTSPPILALFALFAVFLGLFFLSERRAAFPVLDLTLFNNRVFNFSVAAATLQSLGLFAVNFLIIFYLQGVRGFDPLTAALLLIPLPLVSAVVAPISGVVADRIGARLPATVGLLIQGAALVWLSMITVTTPYPVIAGGLAVMGLGGGMFFSPNTSAAMTAAPKNRLGVASAALGTLRQTGMTIGFALSLAVAAASLPRDVMLQIFVGTNVTLGSAVLQNFVLGIRSAFLFSVFLCVLGALFSMARGREDRRGVAQSEQLPPDQGAST
jgi:EmrB/QacA subfamily drug resistance transporter